MKKQLEDGFYEEQVERLSGLPKFPALPKGQQELRHALRRISESDRLFLERLINDVIDTNEFCPTPAELVRRAAEKRSLAPKKTLGNPDCEVCHGSGWESFQKPVRVGNLPEYTGNYARPCLCRT